MMMKFLRTSQNILKWNKVLHFSSQTNTQILNEYRKSWTMYDFRNPQFRHQLAVSMNIANNQKLDYPSKLFEKENSTTIKNILSTVKLDQDIGEVIDVIQNLIQQVEIDFDEEWSSFKQNKFVQELHSNEAFPILMNNLEKGIDSIDDYKILCSIYHVLGNFHFKMKSPVMSKIYVKVMEHAEEIDLESLVLFIEGFSKSIGYTGIYYDMLSIISSRPFQKILSRWGLIIDEASSPKDILQISILLRFIHPIKPDKMFNQFLAKCDQLTDEGLLDPRKAKSPEEIQVILECYIMIAGLGKYFPNHTILNKYIDGLTGFLDHLGPARSTILANKLLYQGYPAESFNEVLRQLKKFANTADSPVYMRGVTKFLSKYGIQNNSLELMEEHFDEKLEDYANDDLAYIGFGRLYRILSFSQENDATKKRNQLLDVFLSVSSICK